MLNHCIRNGTEFEVVFPQTIRMQGLQTLRFSCLLLILVLFLVTSAEDNQPMSSTSTVQEILIESAPDDEVQIPNGDSKTVIIESNEVTICMIYLNKYINIYLN